MAAPRRGEVWLAELDKTRPVVVLTRDPMGRYLNAVLVTCGTGDLDGSRVSAEVPVGSAHGVRVKSVANMGNSSLARCRNSRTPADAMCYL
jgi:mRNA interferase MazF